VAPFESGRRLCLLFEAGPSRYAVEATAVMEVANPDEDGLTIRGHFDLLDLSSLLGGPPEERPGMGVVLDVSPTLAVRVSRIVEVADVAPAPFFMLPPGLGSSLPAITRGALLHGDRLYLELVAEALPHRPPSAAGAGPRAVHFLTEAPERGLVFESQGALYGLPLSMVSQVVARSAAYCPMPSASGPALGLYPHAQALWPIYSFAGLLGGEGRAEPLIVLAEVAGQGIGLSASRVLGVHQELKPSGARGEYEGRLFHGPALFLDMQRMFS
jgi:chemotaxis signal transduction protein